MRGDDPLQPADGFSQFTRKLIIDREPIASNNGQHSLSHMQFFAYKTRPMISGFRLIKFIFIGCLVRVQPDNVL